MSARSDTLLDHIADYIRFLSNAQSFWFTLDTSYDYGCHLASRFHLNPEEYEALSIVARLASYSRYGFKMKPTAWLEFIKGHQFVTSNSPIEFKQKKIDLDAYINGVLPSQDNRRSFYAIRIGNKTEQSANRIENQLDRYGRLLTVLPRLNRLGIKSQSFQIDVSALIWDYKVENDEDNGDDIDDDNSSEGSNEDNDDGKKSKVDDDNDAYSPPTKKRKYSPALVSPAMDKTRGDTVGMDKLYPNLSHALGGKMDLIQRTHQVKRECVVY
jgi:hypothetical protein